MVTALLPIIFIVALSIPDGLEACGSVDARFNKPLRLRQRRVKNDETERPSRGGVTIWLGPHWVAPRAGGGGEGGARQPKYEFRSTFGPHWLTPNARAKAMMLIGKRSLVSPFSRGFWKSKVEQYLRSVGKRSWLGLFAKVVQNAKIEQFLRSVGKRRSFMLSSWKVGKKSLLESTSSKAARYRNMREEVRNNRVFACIVNFLQTSRALSHSSLDSDVEKMGALFAARARLHRCKRAAGRERRGTLNFWTSVG